MNETEPRYTPGRVERRHKAIDEMVANSSDANLSYFLRAVKNVTGQSSILTEIRGKMLKEQKRRNAPKQSDEIVLARREVEAARQKLESAERRLQAVS